MLDFRQKSGIMEKQFHNRQFGTILSLNKTTETTSMKTMVFIEGGCAALYADKARARYLRA